jgi:hypothetical protein
MSIISNQGNYEAHESKDALMRKFSFCQKIFPHFLHCSKYSISSFEIEIGTKYYYMIIITTHTAAAAAAAAAAGQTLVALPVW